MANRRSIIVVSVLAAALSAAPGMALAQAPSSRSAQDLQAIRDYKLSMPVVEKIAKANAAAKQAAAKDPKQQRLAKLEAELAALTAREDLTEAEWKRMGVLEDEIARAEDDGDDGRNGTGSLADFARQVEANPPLAAALRSVGLSSREYATAVFALFEAGMTDAFIEQKLLKQAPPEVSKHNLDFVRQNRVQLTAMGVLSTDDDD